MFESMLLEKRKFLERSVVDDSKEVGVTLKKYDR